MKAIFTRKELIVCLLLPLCLSVGGRVTAQTPVTGIYTHWTNATTTNTYSSTAATGVAATTVTLGTYNYAYGLSAVTSNNTEILDSFTIGVPGGTIYYLASTPPVVKFQRVNNSTVTGLRKSLWFQYSGAGVSGTGGTASIMPDYDDSLERMFAKRVFNFGLDNNFQHSSVTNNNNIERVDVIFPGGLSATDVTKVGFVVFDRGTALTHDSFQVAAIRTLDGTGNPSAYYKADTAVGGNGSVGGSYYSSGNPYIASYSSTGASYISSGTASSMNYHILRRNPTDANLLLMSDNVNQDRDGVFFSLSALSVPVNTRIYGYSIFGMDVNANPASNLVNYADATNFPTNSAFGGGGLDQVAVTGVAITNASYISLADRVDGFNVKPANGKVQLNWTLGVVDDLKELVVERGGNGTDFTPLLEFQAPGTGPQAAVDEQPLPGKNYYRLRLMDNDGTVAAYSSVSSVDMNGTSPVSLHMYPNPVKNKRFRLDAQGLQDEPYDLRVFDMSGNLILVQPLKGAPVFSTNVVLPPGLPVGAYTVQLKDRNGRKVVVNALMVE